MKVVILAGGLGSRLAEYTKSIPKPMVKVGSYPILIHLINIFSSQGFTEFLIAAGYKSYIIDAYFKKNMNNKSKLSKFFKKNKIKIRIIPTGKDSMTGGRLGRLKKYLKNQDFMLTYGDGLSNVNLKELLTFHKKHKKIATVTTVRPPARFGAIFLNKNKIIKFREKSQMSEGWINGGFFIFNSKIFNYLKNDATILEREPLQKLARKGQMMAFKHYGFWQCMDTVRDKEILETELKSKKNKIFLN